MLLVKSLIPTKEAIDAINKTIPFEEVTENSLQATKSYKRF